MRRKQYENAMREIAFLEKNKGSKLSPEKRELLVKLKKDVQKYLRRREKIRRTIYRKKGIFTKKQIDEKKKEIEILRKKARNKGVRLTVNERKKLRQLNTIVQRETEERKNLKRRILEKRIEKEIDEEENIREKIKGWLQGNKKRIASIFGIAVVSWGLLGNAFKSNTKSALPEGRGEEIEDSMPDTGEESFRESIRIPEITTKQEVPEETSFPEEIPEETIIEEKIPTETEAMKVDEKVFINFLKTFEGAHNEVIDIGDEVLTMGVGHTVRPEDNKDKYGNPIYATYASNRDKDGNKIDPNLIDWISDATLEEFLKKDLKVHYDAVEEELRKFPELELAEHQVRALVSLSYNKGTSRAKKCVQAYAEGGEEKLLEAMKTIVFSLNGRFYGGLPKRRVAEYLLFIAKTPEEINNAYENTHESIEEKYLYEFYTREDWAEIQKEINKNGGAGQDALNTILAKIPAEIGMER